jgi:hypothetical protein
MDPENENLRQMFLAMTQFQLEKQEQAQALLGELRQRLENTSATQTKEQRAVLQEATKLMAGTQ